MVKKDQTFFVVLCLVTILLSVGGTFLFGTYAIERVNNRETASEVRISNLETASQNTTKTLSEVQTKLDTMTTILLHVEKKLDERQ